ncbi:MAG: ribonuclease HII [Candidatus Kapabacteria bacterium]|nr:ribonuclease HII [Candidatus Kapabacteria bacterium]
MSKAHISALLNFDIEKEYWQKGLLVAGIDEVGRGCLAGPVTAAAVVFKIGELPIRGVTDSKKLSPKEREKLYQKISEIALDYSFSFIYNEDIDKINILKATMLAMENAILNLNNKPHQLLIDGNSFFNNSYTFKTIIKGDSISPSIAAASIVAKVKRDQWMIEVADKEFPQYDFKTNKGYGTQKHIEAIKKYGICKYHRISFLKNFISKQNTLFNK